MSQLNKYASLQSMTEIGLGSWIHSMHLPGGGHWLSIHQAICLSWACRKSKQPREAAYLALSLGSIAGLMKLLSPAGKKAMPMVAIWMQSACFAAGMRGVGPHRWGAMIGASALALWGFIQPVISAYLLFGETWFRAVAQGWNQLASALRVDPNSGWLWIGFLIGFKVLATSLAAMWAWTASESFEERYFERLQRWFSKRARSPLIDQSEMLNFQSPGVGALLDLLNPLFLISLLICVVFLGAQSGVYVVRTVVLSYLIFLGLRLIPADRFERWAKKYPELSATLDQLRASRT